MSIRALGPELAELARVELNEDPKRIEGDLQHIKDWLKKQPHIHARTDDQWLLLFLRGCKYSLERTKEKLDLYYSLRTLAPELFRIGPNDKFVSEVLDLGTYVILTKTSTPTSPVVSIVRPGTYDPEKYDINDLLSVSNLIQKILLAQNDNMVIAGVQTVLDLANVTLAHFLQMSPTVMKKMVILTQDATPIRMKGTHYINTPPGFETVFGVMKNMLNEKNRGRLYVHNRDYESLYKHIPKDILPEEYGGSAGTIKEITDYWKNKVKENSSWLEEDLKYGTDESKRPGKPNTAESLFGVDGSFRQLEFD